LSRTWWQERVVYQIYPRSFQDTNGDGIGDLPGIITHLDDLQALGVGVLWLSPVNPSPNIDFGYDVSNYRDIHPDYGTLSDMKRLISEAARRDIRIIMDLVVNHTSDQHDWFQKSRRRIEPFMDYYIWLPGKNGGPPNNWTGFFGGSCWTYDELRGEYYLHLFAREQPDLNFRCPDVVGEVKAILRFWLDLGVAGFRGDVINGLHKGSLADGKRSLILTGSEHYLSHEGTHYLIHRLNTEVLKDYDCFTVGETTFVTPAEARAFCDPARQELDMIFSFAHMETDQILVKWFKRRFHAGRLMRALATWQDALDWNANYLENHDQPRSVSRFGDDRRWWKPSAKLLAVLLLTLRGTPFLYQGEEIGMTNFDYTSMDQIRDTESILIDRLARRLHFPAWIRWRMMRMTSRSNARTPMQWDATAQAGFTAGTPWLGVNRNHDRINYADQQADPDSILHFYRKMIALRAASEVLIDGSFRLLYAGRRLSAYERILNQERWTILLNFSSSERSAVRFVPAGAQLILSSAGSKSFSGMLLPYEAVILRREAVT
jgi:oligo-1,6-glucosidase